ncbi:hypothetical protein [Microcoleus sp.]|uniref:hypothetical protein n=1 Tax=Microcoleus sp. TaxID=44472 RepID=UPI0035240EDA
MQNKPTMQNNQLKIIMDIPDSLLLTVVEISKLKAIFKKRLGREPDVVVLPVLGFWGASFESEYIDEYIPQVAQPSNNENSIIKHDFSIIKHDLTTLMDLTRNQLPNAKIYLSLNMAFEFLQSEYTCTYDQYGQSSSQACIVNPSVNSLLKKFINEVVTKFKPDGIVLDLVDINPQSGDQKSKLVKINCFCSHCEKQLDPFDISKQDFIDSPNALNLVLQPTQTGVTFTSIDPKWKTDELIVASKSKKIYDENIVKDNETRWANKILSYARARSQVTANAIANLLKDVPSTVQKAVILDGSRFEWTSGTSPIAIKGIVNQVWTQVETFTEKPPEGVELYHYMFNRARYTLDSFFNILSDRNLISRANVNNAIYLKIREQALSRALKVIQANQLSLAGLNVAAENPLISGIVGVPLDPVENELLRKLLETYAPEVKIPDGSTLQLLKNLFATNPDNINLEE